MISVNNKSCSVSGVQREVSVFLGSACCLLSYLVVAMHEYDRDVPLEDLVSRATSKAISIFFSKPDYVDVSNCWVKNPDGVIKSVLGYGFHQVRIDNFDNVDAVLSDFKVNQANSDWIIARLGPADDSHFVVVNRQMDLVWDPTTNSKSLSSKKVTSLRAIARS